MILASRVLSVFFLYTAIANLINMPSFGFSILHHWQGLNGNATVAEYSYDLYLFRLDVYGAAAALLRLTAEAAFALAFYRCGDGITRFMLQDVEEGKSSDTQSSM